MIASILPSRSPRWLVLVLLLLLLSGHACELPAYADLVVRADAAEEAHHATGDHGDEQVVWCDAVDVAPSPGCSLAGLGLDTAIAVPVAGPVPVGPVTQAPDDVGRQAIRPPLFLLFASLLI